MRLTATRLVAPLALLSLVAMGGCRDVSASRDVAARDALQKDLELAQAASVSLAARANDLPATRFVSALEAGEKPTAGAGRAANPVHHASTRAPRTHTEHAPPAVTEVAAAQGAPAAAAETAPAPVVAAAPAPAPESAPSQNQTESQNGPGDVGVFIPQPGDGRGSGGNGSGGATVGRRGHGGGLGGILGGIGVVLRGGGVGDDDHCERDHPGSRGGLPFPIGGTGMGGMGRSGGMPRSRFPVRL